MSFNHPSQAVADNVLQPKPAKKPFLYAGGESEAAREMITSQCDGYVTHGASPEQVGEKIADMKERREKKDLPPMKYGVAAYSIVRNNEQEVKKELERITNVEASSRSYKNNQEWLANTQLQHKPSHRIIRFRTGGLRSGLSGTPAQVQDQVAAFEQVGVDFFLLQCSPQLEEMERFSESVIGVLQA